MWSGPLELSRGAFRQAHFLHREQRDSVSKIAITTKSRQVPSTYVLLPSLENSI
jgi:hypothetical protein